VQKPHSAYIDAPAATTSFVRISIAMVCSHAKVMACPATVSDDGPVCESFRSGVRLAPECRAYRNLREFTDNSKEAQFLEQVAPPDGLTFHRGLGGFVSIEVVSPQGALQRVTIVTMAVDGALASMDGNR
jgi:hypothetical protein